MNSVWRILPYAVENAAEALAGGGALLSELAADGAPTVRWYGARGLALVIGSGQKLADIDATQAAAAGVPIHRRASGGTAVLFTPGFLMQDIALPHWHPLFRDDVSESYRWLGEIWAETLKLLDIAVSLVSVLDARNDTRTADPLLRRACFGGLSPYELLADRRKLVGFSQVRRRQGALLQVGIYTSWPGQELANLLSLPSEQRAELVERLAGRVVGLDELLPTPPPLAAIEAAFATALGRLGVELTAGSWSAAELAAQAAALARFAPITPAATAGAAPAS